MNFTIGTIMRAVALVCAVLIALFAPPKEVLWLALDVGLLAAGTLIP